MTDAWTGAWEYCYLMATLSHEPRVRFCKASGQTIEQIVKQGENKDDDSIIGLLGAHGWEMIAIDAGPKGMGFYFKRPERSGRGIDDIVKALS